MKQNRKLFTLIMQNQKAESRVKISRSSDKWKFDILIEFPRKILRRKQLAERRVNQSDSKPRRKFSIF